MVKVGNWTVPMSAAKPALMSALMALLAASHASAAVSEGRPAVGRHAAELCVATTDAAPTCGPAHVDLRRTGSARVQVDDVVYRLQLHSRQVEVVLMHGAMQIDEFTVPYAWVGRSLQFKDDERHVRYEVRFTSK
jgi:hypothetical protein